MMMVSEAVSLLESVRFRDLGGGGAQLAVLVVFRHLCRGLFRGLEVIVEERFRDLEVSGHHVFEMLFVMVVVVVGFG